MSLRGQWIAFYVSDRSLKMAEDVSHVQSQGNNNPTGNGVNQFNVYIQNNYQMYSAEQPNLSHLLAADPSTPGLVLEHPPNQLLTRSLLAQGGEGRAWLTNRTVSSSRGGLPSSVPSVTTQSQENIHRQTPPTQHRQVQRLESGLSPLFLQHRDFDCQVPFTESASSLSEQLQQQFGHAYQQQQEQQRISPNMVRHRSMSEYEGEQIQWSVLQLASSHNQRQVQCPPSVSTPSLCSHEEEERFRPVPGRSNNRTSDGGYQQPPTDLDLPADRHVASDQLTDYLEEIQAERCLEKNQSVPALWQCQQSLSTSSSLSSLSTKSAADNDTVVFSSTKPSEVVPSKANIPSRDVFPGEFGFKAVLTSSHTALYTYTEETKTLCTSKDADFAVTFSFSVRPRPGFTVRALVTCKHSKDIETIGPVKRCPNHFHKERDFQYFLMCRNDQAIYKEHFSHNIISIPLDSMPECDAGRSCIFSCRCYSTCVVGKGANRPSLVIVFSLLDTDKAQVVGQDVINLKCCASPNRKRAPATKNDGCKKAKKRRTQEATPFPEIPLSSLPSQMNLVDDAQPDEEGYFNFTWRTKNKALFNMLTLFKRGHELQEEKPSPVID